MNVAERVCIEVLRVTSPSEKDEAELRDNGYERYGYFTQEIQNWEKVVSTEKNIDNFTIRSTNEHN